ncbi:1,2-phenylacetyl-CoA epoxidase subunit PaaD [Mesonia sp. K7]|uniref:1,2-phenylacetyl-CoA epoxidase subunit PaaD n=1 Tax=Mesonia sp. K7 TaxID=2218606 RepID=UPI000DAA3A5E|nr:1,2-phenylacetyl-CoA epoxidase subunit PaaD [Mesonia sp. K7]PZD78679.1 phenylacetate-CoA oxygenase subunit PaaJ [Mesonia sp. K7]
MTIEEAQIDKELIPILEKVSDPEIPVLTVLDLGVVRFAKITKPNFVEVKITPTYSGCPAMDVIGDDITSALSENGYETKVDLVLAPAWTTDMITESGRKTLEEYGIAPPMDAVSDKKALLGEEQVVKCPQCHSTNTKMVSQFGSTACKALFKCHDCQEPFDYFKCLI